MLKRKLPVRRRALRNRWAARGSDALPLFDVPQGARRRVPLPRGDSREGFPLGKRRGGDNVV